jgi:imidazolonepropionase-like amidohydrolase
MKRLLAFLLFVGCATATPLPSVPAEPSWLPAAPTRTWRQPKPVVIRHATVLTASGPAISDGAIAFAEGTIIAVGKNGEVQTPAGAEEIDATGKVVTPGIIDAHSHLGVYASPGTVATDDGNEMTAPVTAEVAAEHGFWPQDPGLRRAAAGGVTALLVLPGSANLIGGRGFPVKLHFGRSASEVRFPGAKDALKIACGENPKRVYGKEKKAAPGTRMGNAAGYRQAFAAARDYLAKWEDFREKSRKTPGMAGPPPMRDLKLETLAGVLKGEILVQNHCYRADEMQLMMNIADEFGFRIRAFHHALEAYKVRDVLAKKGVAVATWADWWGFKLEAWDGIPENAGLISQAGGRAIIHSDSALGIQRLNQEAGKAMWRARESGIPISEEEALRWITLNPAWAMGVDDRTGSLTPGKMADVVVWNRNPFSVYARAERVYADGVLTFDLAGGAADLSDFEAGGPPDAASTLTAAPAKLAVAAGESASLGCDPARRGACPALLERGQDSCLAIVGATVLVDGKPTPGVTVVVEGGKISRVEPSGAPPPGCRTIDGKGKTLAPGFIEPSTQLGLTEIELEEQSNDIGFRAEAAKEPIHAALQAAQSINPASAMIPVARLGGITGAIASPEGGLIPGQSAYFTLDGTIQKTPLALVVNLGVRGHDALQSPRGWAIERFRELLDDAKEYAKRKADFEQNRIRRLAASRLDLDALQPVLAGKVPVVFRADRVSDIRALIALAREHGLRAVVSGGSHAWQMGKELAAAKIPVILQPTNNLPESLDRQGNRCDSAARLVSQGVKVLFSTDGMTGLVRTLPQEAGNAVAWGLAYEDAVRAISANVAETFGLEAGRVAAGAPADLVLWSGDPLEVSSRPLAMWIGGKQVPLESRQQALFRKYRALPE